MKAIFHGRLGALYLLCALMVALAGRTNARGDTLITQPRGGGNVYGPSGVWAASNLNQEVADDFQAVGSIDRVLADGFLENASQFQGVYIRFYEAGSDGTPGALQKEYFFSTGLNTTTGAIDVSLSPAFSATGQHFLSVQPVMKGWYWWDSSSGSPHGAGLYHRNKAAGETVWTPGDGTPSTNQSDLAFRLYGTSSGPGTISSLSATTVTRSGYLEIRGSNLGSSGTVLIDGKAAPIADWNSGSILAYVPEAAALGSVTVQVINGSGQPSNTVPLNVTARQSQGRINWRFRQAGPYSTIRPVIAPDGTVHSIDANFHLYALAPDGALKWVARGAGDSGLAVGPDGTVYVGSQFYVRAYTPEGVLKWSFLQNPSALNFVGISVGPDGNIYAVASDGLGAFSLTPGGTLRWQRPEPQVGRPINFCELVFGPNGANTQFYYYTNRHLRAFRLDGTPVFTIEGAVAAPPQAQPAVSPDGSVHQTFRAFSPNGNLLWNFVSPYADNVRTPPDLGGNGVHFFTQNTIELFALNPNGSQRWHVTLDDGVQGPIVDPTTTQLVIGHALSADRPGFIASHSTDDGRELWRVPLATEDPTIPNPWTGQMGFNQASDSRPRFRPDGTAVYMITFVATGDVSRDRSFLYSIDPTISNNTPLIPVSVVSRKTHGTAGTFDLALPFFGAMEVEPRSGGATGDHRIIFTFAEPVTFAGIDLTPAAARVKTSTTSTDGKQVTVDLTNVADGQILTVRLLNVNSHGDVAISLRMLLGDVNASGSVNASDISAVKARSGLAPTNAIFRMDLNANGMINASDASLVKSCAGGSISGPTAEAARGPR